MVLFPYILCVVIFAGVLCSSSTVVQNAQRQRRVYAIGDIHGDLNRLLDLLTAEQLIDLPTSNLADVKWIGNGYSLVQLGDVVDRGRDDLDVYRLFSVLKPQIENAGGSLRLLFGNHELMNMCGDQRYVSLESFEHNYNKSEDLWRFKWSPKGGIGRWVRQHLEVYAVVENRFVFVHGGLCDVVAQFSPGALKRRFLQQVDEEDCNAPLTSFEGSLESLNLIGGDESPVWTRRQARHQESVVCPEIESALDDITGTSTGPKFLMVGHCITRSQQIEGRCLMSTSDTSTQDNCSDDTMSCVPRWTQPYHFLMLDVGMSSYISPAGVPTMLRIDIDNAHLKFIQVQALRPDGGNVHVKRSLLQVVPTAIASRKTSS